jgi:hypothetical protein
VRIERTYRNARTGDFQGQPCADGVGGLAVELKIRKKHLTQE